MTVARTFAVVGLGLAIAGAVGTAVVRYVVPAPFITEAFGYGGATMVGYVIAGLTWASVGALLVVRRPDNAVGWVMVPVGVGYVMSQVSVALTFALAAQGTPQSAYLAQIAGWVTILLQLVTVFQVAIGFIFPSGRAQSPRWARFMRIFWAFASVVVVISLTQPGPLQLIPALENPFGFGPDLRGDRQISPLLVAFMVIIFATLLVSMVSRYRAADSVERTQLKWFVLALGLSAIGLGIALSEALVIDRPANPIGLTVFIFAGALVPVAIGIAILRHRLYDIDRLISRSLGYALVTGVLAAIFAASTIGLSTILGSFAQGESLAVAVSTLLVLALFGPLRRRAQAAIDRRFDRSRYDASLTVQAMTERLRDDVDLERVEADVLGVVGRTFHPTSSALWLRGRRTVSDLR
jgi:hypothetical protein